MIGEMAPQLLQDVLEVRKGIDLVTPAHFNLQFLTRPQPVTRLMVSPWVDDVWLIRNEWGPDRRHLAP